MVEIFFTLSLIISFAGICMFILKKISVFERLPQTSSPKINKKDIILKFAKRIKNITPLKKFSGELFLQKALSKVRVVALRIDNKTVHWLAKLREKAQKNRFGEHDTYWKEIKSSANESQKVPEVKRQRKKRLPDNL